MQMEGEEGAREKSDKKKAKRTMDREMTNPVKEIVPCPCEGVG